MYRVDNAIIMAAGTSSRFAPLSYETHKGLLTVRGEVLIERQIRQTTSALVYGIVLLPILHGWGFTVSLFTSGTGWLLPVIAAAAFFATVSYLCYYRAIAAIGASKSMALNVTYAAWAIFFTAVFLGDTSVLTPTTIICALIVIVCGILTAADGKELFSKNRA